MDYQKMYTTMFNGVTDALREITAQNYGRAQEILKQAQIDAEQLFLLQEEDV